MYNIFMFVIYEIASHCFIKLDQEGRKDSFRHKQIFKVNPRNLLSTFIVCCEMFS